MRVNQEHITKYCAAFDLGIIDDEITQQQVRMRSRACPNCSARPLMYGAAISIPLHFSEKKQKLYVAGQLLCGCGRACALIDYRDIAKENAEFDRGRIPPLSAIMSTLIQDWNG